MKLTCPRCGSENELGETKDADARTHACASCGANLSANERVRHASHYDGYAVARRVLKVVPAWLLLCIAGFVVVLLLFKWASRPVGKARGVREDEFKNEATNRPPPQTSPFASRANAKPSDSPREDAGRGAGPSAGETPYAPATEAGGRGASDAQSASDAQGASDAEESASFSVQTGAFDDRSQANELVSHLRAAGFDARVVEADASKRFRFQVRSGLFRTREDAARLAAQLRSKGVAVQTVIVEPSQK
jgi:cell division septation protein DedD